MPYKYKKLTKKDLNKLYPLFFDILNDLSNKYYPKEIIDEFKKFYTKEYFFKNVLGGKHAFAFGYFDKKELIAFAFGEVTSTSLLYLDWVGVKKDFRRQGMLIKLLKDVEKEAKARNAYKVYFYTCNKNIRAINGYLKLGYKISGILKNHFYGGDFFQLGKVIKKRRFNFAFQKLPGYKPVKSDLDF